MANLDLWLLLALSVVGIADIWLERLTGRGIIARVQDKLEVRRD